LFDRLVRRRHGSGGVTSPLPADGRAGTETRSTTGSANVTAASGTRSRAFRRDVEGLRAVAIILVVGYHTHLRLLSGGYVGVDVFFVISGFLITGQLTRELEDRGRISLLGFYARRARRILPAASVVTIVTVIASARLLAPLEARRVFGDATAAIFFGVNFRLAAQGANYFDNSIPPSPLQHFWSLSVEEQFYLVWPVLLVLSSLVWVKRRSHPPAFPVVFVVLVAVAVVSFAICVHETTQSPPFAYYSILSRAWELAVGALAAMAGPFAARLNGWTAAALTWTGLIAVVLAATMFGSTTTYPGFNALVPVLGAAAIVTGGAAARAGRGVQALLGTAPFQRVGSWSYSWYLWHYPALILAPAVVGHALSVPQNLIIAGDSLVVAVASYELIERPIRRMQLMVRRPALGLGGGGVLIATSLAVVLLSGSTLPALAATGAATLPAVAKDGGVPPSQLSLDLLAGVKTTKVPVNLDPKLANAAKSVPVIVSNGCNLQHAGTKSKPCIYGDVTSKTTVVLFGDSHAAAWFPALQVISVQQHWRLVDLTKAGCPPPEASILYTGTSPYPQCTAWRRNAMAQIAGLHPLLVVADWARYLEEPEARTLAGVPTGHGSAWLNGVAAIFAFLHRAATHVVFMSDTPTLNQLAPDCVSAHLDDVEACTSTRLDAVRLPVVKHQELVLAQQAHVVAVDPDSWFCTPTRCPVIVGNILLYRDNAHMTPAWSRFIAPVFGAAIVAAVRRSGSGS
jgi:peptidoglycan/LPS O-acetylase OafA/YrhL